MPLVTGNYVLASVARNAPVHSTNKCYDKQSNTYITVHASPSALFKIENWRAAIIMVLMSPAICARGLTAHVHQGPTKSQPAPNGVICEPVAPYNAPKREGFWPGRHTGLLYARDVVCVSRPPPSVHTTHGKICHTSRSMTTKVPWRGLKSSNAPHSIASTHVWRSSASFTYKTTFTGARRSTDLEPTWARSTP
jgi:hypothetical protein